MDINRDKQPENVLTKGLVQDPSIDNERALIGGILANPEIAIPKVIEVRLSQTDFFQESYGEIYATILAMYEHNLPVDLLTLSNELARRGILEKVGGSSALASIATEHSLSFHVQTYAGYILEKSTIRALTQVASHIAIRCQNPEEKAEDILDAAEAEVLSIRDNRSSFSLEYVPSKLESVFDNVKALCALDGALSGLSSGYKLLDDMTGGFQKSDLIILGGRPGMGKTAMALSLALRAAIPRLREAFKDTPPVSVAIFSMEMSSEQLMQRLICQVGHHNLLDMRTGKMDDDATLAMIKTFSIMKNAPIYIDQTGAIRPSELRAKARRLQNRLKNTKLPLGLVVIDYLQLMRPNNRHQNREQDISEISGALKSMAKELNLPVLTLSQLSRQSEKSGTLSLSDLRESGAIEQDADIVAFIERREVVEPGKPDLKGQGRLIIRKHRNGPIGSIPLCFIHNSASFEPATV